ncbi:MAG: hypothetical protein WBZ01_06400 [Terriglobales bacterium]|jgi:hypothetical protein
MTNAVKFDSEITALVIDPYVVDPCDDFIPEGGRPLRLTRSA